ncbi:MAG TPA: dienelactone hydrolase family protein [Tenuifilaceae bacterium]|nr:dienelactone hydrolase family protein [Tenuifilaceae bacterium]HPQ32939.1 dienelactone hydrolase family protein [Tenuifilaceae bacterium]
MGYSQRFFFLLLSLLTCTNILAQQTVNFISDDGVTVTADQYVSSTQYPYIILLHQAGFSRGEYRETAPKLVNLGFNCLAVDLRSGDEANFVKNQTAIDAKSKKLPTNYIDAIPDIRAAITYVASQTTKPIILLGSSYSASLALIEATNNFKVDAVIAFSPGEYFEDKTFIKNTTKELFIPVLALCSKVEYSAMKNMLDHVPQKHLSLFKPSQGEGVHGSRALWENNPNNQEYWMALTMFFSNLNLK